MSAYRVLLMRRVPAMHLDRSGRTYAIEVASHHCTTTGALEDARLRRERAMFPVQLWIAAKRHPSHANGESK